MEPKASSEGASITFSMDSDWFEPNTKIQKAKGKKITLTYSLATLVKDTLILQ